MRRLNSSAPVVLVGCQADMDATSSRNGEEKEIIPAMDAVMHVETSAKTSAKSVWIAFQVLKKKLDGVGPVDN